MLSQGGAKAIRWENWKTANNFSESSNDIWVPWSDEGNSSGSLEKENVWMPWQGSSDDENATSNETTWVPSKGWSNVGISLGADKKTGDGPWRGSINLGDSKLLNSNSMEKNASWIPWDWLRSESTNANEKGEKEAMLSQLSNSSKASCNGGNCERVLEKGPETRTDFSLDNTASAQLHDALKANPLLPVLCRTVACVKRWITEQTWDGD
jgi:hypothetical protein